MEEKRTYVPYTQWKEPSIQREYTQETPLLDDSGKLTITAADAVYDGNSRFVVGLRHNIEHIVLSQGSLQG